MFPREIGERQTWAEFLLTNYDSRSACSCSSPSSSSSTSPSSCSSTPSPTRSPRCWAARRSSTSRTRTPPRSSAPSSATSDSFHSEKDVRSDRHWCHPNIYSSRDLFHTDCKKIEKYDSAIIRAMMSVRQCRCVHFDPDRQSVRASAPPGPCPTKQPRP